MDAKEISKEPQTNMSKGSTFFNCLLSAIISCGILVAIGLNQTKFENHSDKQQNHSSTNLDEPLRIFLVGMTGAGRSATGNTILRKEVFKSGISSCSLTKQCEKSNATVNGRNILVIDTPGLFDASLTKDEVIDKMKHCILLSAPGPHVFLVVIQLGRFTDEEAEAVKIIQTVFGEESSTYTMALFTHGDRLEGKNIHTFVRDSPKLLSFIRTCSGRFHVFNNVEKNLEQVIQLFEEIDKIVTGNGAQHYTNEILERAKAIEVERRHILKEKEEQRIKEIEALRATHKGKTFEKAKENLDNKYEQQALLEAEKKIQKAKWWIFS